MKKAFTTIRVSAEDQLRGYGPDAQWFEDVLPAASLLGLEVSERLKVVIQEPATGWDREIFQKAVHEAMRLHRESKVEALLFPRVDRETRFLFGSFPLLAEVIRSGMEVYFARERFRLDPDDPESVQKYLNKATQAQAYVETMRENTMKGKRRRAVQDHKMPSGGRKWAFDYDPATGRYKKNESRAAWVAKCYQWILEEGLSLSKCCLRLQQAEVAPPGWEMWKKAKDRGREWRKRRPPVSGTWHRYTLHSVLIDPANMGKFYAYCHQRVKAADGKRRLKAVDPEHWMLVYEDPGQAIITPDQHEAFKVRMRRNQENSSRHTKHAYPPLRGMVTCTLCQKRMVGWTHHRSGIAYYKCPDCRNRVLADKLWDELKRQIEVKLLEPGRLLPGIQAQMADGQAMSRLQDEEKTLAEQLESWEHARDKARRLYFISKDYPEERFLAEDRRMVEKRDKMANDLAAVRKQIDSLGQAMLDEEGIKRFCAEAARNLSEMSPESWRLLLERMRLRLQVTPGQAVEAHIALPSLSGEGGAVVYQLSA